MERLEPVLADNVTYAEMQAELARLRAAVALLASRLGTALSADDAKRILELIAPPDERNVAVHGAASSPEPPAEPIQGSAAGFPEGK
jgi:hypothetical protein